MVFLLKQILDQLAKNKEAEKKARAAQYADNIIGVPTAPQQQARGPLGATSDPRGLYGVTTSAPSTVATVDPGVTGRALGLNQPYDITALTSRGHPTERDVLRDQYGQILRASGDEARDHAVVDAVTRGGNTVFRGADGVDRTALASGSTANLVTGRDQETTEPKGGK